MKWDIPADARRRRHGILEQPRQNPRTTEQSPGGDLLTENPLSESDSAPGEGTSTHL